MHFWDLSAFKEAGLDELDCKILYALDCNCRQSNAAIGKKLRVNKNVVGYRITKLIENDFIERFFAVVDSPKMGCQSFRVYLKCSTVDEKKRQEVIDFVAEHKHIWWSGIIDGDFDLGFLVWVKNIYEFRDFWVDFLSRFQDRIQNTRISIYNGIYAYASAFIYPEELKDKPFQIVGKSFDNIQISDNDQKVLSFISEHAREPLVSAAKKLGLSSVTVKYSLRKLERLGIILAYRAQLNYAKLGYIMYKLNLHLKNRSRLGTLLEYVRSCPHIVYFNDAIGFADFEVEMCVRKYEEFKAIRSELLALAGDSLAGYDHFIYYRVHDLKYYPE